MRCRRVQASDLRRDVHAWALLPSLSFHVANLFTSSIGATQVVVVPRGSRRESRMSPPARVAALCVEGDVTPRPRCYWPGVKGKVHLRGTEDTPLGEVTATSGPRRLSYSVLQNDPPPPEAQCSSGNARRYGAQLRNGRVHHGLANRQGLKHSIFFFLFTAKRESQGHPKRRKKKAR